MQLLRHTSYGSAVTARSRSLRAVTASAAQMLAPQVAVATTPACPYCRKAKAALADLGQEYFEVDVSMDPKVRSLVRELSGKATVPQVFVGGVSLGGSDDLQRQLADGSFQAAVSRAAAAGTPALPKELLQLAQTAAAQSSGPQLPSVDRGLLQLASRMQEPSQGMPCQLVTVGSNTVRAFTGQALLDWLAANAAGSAAEGQAAAMLQVQLIAPVTAQPPWLPIPLTQSLPTAASLQEPAVPQVQPQALYHFTQGQPPPPKGQPLNNGFWWTSPARPADLVAEELRGLMLQLYDRHLSQAGRAVSYAGIRADPVFAQFTWATAELQRVDLRPLSRDQLCALGINLYNMLIIHAMVVHGVPGNTLQRSQFFTGTAAYCIGGYTYTADDLEHGVLRGNKAPAARILALLGFPQWAAPQFKASDPRAAKVVQPMDPRVHCALVCGAKSCPPIAVYSADRLEEGLAAAAEAFCSSEVSVDLEARTVSLSMIFKWYGVDFGYKVQDRLQSLLALVQGPTRAALQQLLSDGKPYKVVYRPYDWALNE